MDGAVFTYDIVLTYLHAGGRVRIKTKILRKRTDHGPVPDPIILSDLNRSGNHSVALNLRAGRDLNGTFNENIRTNDSIGINLSLRINNGSAMDHPEYCKRKLRLLLPFLTFLLDMQRPVKQKLELSLTTRQRPVRRPGDRVRGFSGLKI